MNGFGLGAAAHAPPVRLREHTPSRDHSSVRLVEINISYDGRRLPWVESVMSSANGTSSIHVRKQISVGLPG